MEILRCETCKRRIEALNEEDAIDDMDGHGWCNWKTAHHLKCYDCATDYDDYETYYAGRIKRGYPNRVYQLVPDISRNSDKLIECFFERTK